MTGLEERSAIVINRANEATIAELRAVVEELRARDLRWQKMCAALTDELLVAGAKVAAVKSLALDYELLGMEAYGLVAKRIDAALASAG